MLCLSYSTCMYKIIINIKSVCLLRKISTAPFFYGFSLYANKCLFSTYRVKPRIIASILTVWTTVSPCNRVTKNVVISIKIVMKHFF